jgi:selenocysteine lyase/cysteine desulfurase
VQYAPHGPIDVQDIGCDFLACSAYKFFGPHVGILYGKREHLESLPAYKVRPAPDKGPDRWETGTKNHEGIAGTKAAIDYFEWIGETFGQPFLNDVKLYKGRRRTLKQGMLAIKAYEQSLSQRLIEGLGSIRNITVAGITDVQSLSERVPTVVFNIKGKKPAQVATDLGAKGIYVWDGNYYALEVMERLGLESQGGMVRVGGVHYNTQQEIDRFLREVDALARGKSVSKAPARKTTKAKTKQPAPSKASAAEAPR